LNISAKYHQNRSLQFRAIPFQSWCIFETQCTLLQCNIVSMLSGYRAGTRPRGPEFVFWPCHYSTG